ncbi:MAG: hypothetical protein V1904_03500 [Bacteroidota bacterium]
MKTNDNIQKDDLEETNPNLFSVSKENPFDVPENYFEDLSNEISDKCNPSDRQKPIYIIKGTFQKVFIPLAVAASVILFILISHRKNDKDIINSDRYAYTDIINTSGYLENLIDNDELDESLIISELINDDTIKSNAKNEQADERINALNENPLIINDTANNITITEDDIIQYLLEEDESDDLLY